MNSLSRRRAGARNGARLAETAIREEKERQAAEATARQDELKEQRKVAREAEVARIKFAAFDLMGASHVRDATGWHRVMRVNAKSVTVETPHSWTERIPLERVLQYAVDGKAVA